MVLKSWPFKFHISSDISLFFEAIIQPVQNWLHRCNIKSYLPGNIKYVKPVECYDQVKELTERIHLLESALADAQLENLAYRKFIKASEKKDVPGIESQINR